MKFLLDTSVLSEPSKPRPNASVIAGLERHRDEIATASLVIHELRYGVDRLPRGRKRSILQAYLEVVLESGLPVIPYDREAAQWHGKKRAELERAGRTPAFVDGQIASIAAVNGLIVVTRNDKDFAPFAIDVENWFDGRAGQQG